MKLNTGALKQKIDDALAKNEHTRRALAAQLQDLIKGHDILKRMTSEIELVEQVARELEDPKSNGTKSAA